MNSGFHAPLRSLFAEYVANRRARGALIVQPRMGFSDPHMMRRGLRAVRSSRLPAVGTVTLDSYTRQGDDARAAAVVAAGGELNGYPLVALGARRTARMLDGLQGPDFPVQLRHGSALPEEIFKTMVRAGVDASEGGPVSYCLPYSRVPLRRSVAAWARATRYLAGYRANGVTCHLETFGGCMLGQLCHPSLLVALSILECLFFVEHGLGSVSASYAQQVHPDQDAEALWALRQLANQYLVGVDWHVVLYTYMGLYPVSRPGARLLLAESARLAARTGTERLIVKTVAEAYRIPTVTENIGALRLAATTATAAASTHRAEEPPDPTDSEIYQQARLLIAEVRNLAPTLADALPAAFERGLLDVPYCLHPDNRNEARCVVGPDGRLAWQHTGRLPLARAVGGRVSAARLVFDLAHHRRRLDPTPARPALSSSVPF